MPQNENEEPEGPNLPPKPKKADSANLMHVEIKSSKYIELKGIIGAFASALTLISYIVYYYYYYSYGIKLNELYFISSGIGICIFTGLLFTFFTNICVKTVLLFTSIFYAILEIAYISVWILQGEPYAYIKISLIAGLLIGTIYFAYDKLANKPRNPN